MERGIFDELNHAFYRRFRSQYLRMRLGLLIAMADAENAPLIHERLKSST